MAAPSINSNLSPDSDEGLMSRYQQRGQQSAFSKLYERYFTSLSKYIAWLANDVEKGQDLAQNIFLKIYQDPSTFDATRNFKVWLFTIAKNQWKNEIRNTATRNKYESSAVFDDEPSGKDTDEIRQVKQRLALVKSAVEQLSENHKEVFILKYSNNLSILEISEVCACSPGTVKSRLFYALKYLKEKVSITKIQEL